ncbi:MAG TPA: YceI family protein [Chitinophagaceae bacterium]|nr:YceI family protein [Chitinophagaceae bacterium]
MKKIFFILLAGSITMTACVSNPDGDKAETGDAATPASGGDVKLEVDTAASSLAWAGRKVSGAHNGTVKIQGGELSFAAGKLAGGNFVIDMQTITNLDLTDAEYKAKLEGHLKADDFFAADKYPTSKFEITSVADNGNNQVTISGNLAIRDSIKNITFPATITENTADKFAANADFNIKRQDWGVKYTGMKDDLISDEINFKISLVAAKK